MKNLQQQDQAPMDARKNPNIETTNNHHHVLPSPPSSSQDFKKIHHQYNVSKRTHENEGFIFKNGTEVIKKLNFLSSSSSLAAGEGYPMQPPQAPPPPPPQDFKKTPHQHNVSKRTHEDQGFIFKKPSFLSSSSIAAGEGYTMPLPQPSPPPPQDFKKAHHQHNVSNRTHEDKGFIFKNAPEVIKKPNFLSSSSLAAGEGYPMQPPPPPPRQDFKKTHHQHNIHASKKINENEGFTINNTNWEVIKKPNNSLSCSSPAAQEENTTTPPAEVEESGRERLTRHRVEMAGRVRIPDVWGHEDLLKDWIDCTVFDSSLGNNTIMSARAALVQERRSSTLKIKNEC